MSAPSAPAAQPAAAGSYDGQIEAAGVMLGMWLPAALFGNGFAVVFLVLGLLLYFPQIKRYAPPRPPPLGEGQGCGSGWVGWGGG